MTFSNTATFAFSPTLSGMTFWIRMNSWFGGTMVLNGGQKYVILKSNDCIHTTNTAKTTATTILNKDDLPVKITYDDVQDFIESLPVFQLLPNSNKKEFDDSFLNSMIKCIL